MSEFLAQRSRTWKRLAKAWRTQAAYVHEEDTMGARLRNWFLYKTALKYLQGVAVALDVKGNDPQAIVDAAKALAAHDAEAVEHLEAANRARERLRVERDAAVVEVKRLRSIAKKVIPWVKPFADDQLDCEEFVMAFGTADTDE